MPVYHILEVEYIDEYTYMNCKKKVDYDLICISLIGDGDV